MPLEPLVSGVSKPLGLGSASSVKIISLNLADYFSSSLRGGDMIWPPALQA